jgi:hypothetical protein
MPRGEQEVLIHQSCQLNYDERGVLIIDSGKIHMKNAFTNENWSEIEQFLTNYPSSNSNSPKNNSLLYFFCCLSIFLAGFFLLIFNKKRRKFKVNK